MSLGGVLWLATDDRVTRLPAGWTTLVSHGRQAWRWRLLDQRRRYLGDLGGVTDGRLELRAHADTPGTGSMTWTGLAEDEPDWRKVLAQPVFTLVAPDGSQVEFPMGALIPARPKATHHGRYVSVPVSLFDRTLRLRQSKIVAGYSRTPAHNITDTVTELAAEALGGDDEVVITASAETFRAPAAWDEPGTEYLRVGNDCLEMVNYNALWADPGGLVRADPYVRPADRPLAWTFTEGALGVHHPEWGKDRNFFDAPNTFVAYSRTDGDAPPLVASAAIPDGHPLSAVSRGPEGHPYYVHRVETGIETATQGTLQATVNRWRDEAMTPTTTITLRHFPLPLWPGMRVDFAPKDHPKVTCVVENIVVESLAPDTWWRTTLREVAA